jgi:prophage antirepressor-like protein
MNELTVFQFNNNPINVINIDGEPWFVASETCHVLELDVSDAIKRLDDDEKVSTDSIRTAEIERIKSKWLISESGLYSLVLGCRKPIAKPFKKWVTSEVLPSIRKTGSYSIKELTPGELLKMHAEAMIAVEKQQREQAEKLQQHDSRLGKIEDRFAKVSEELRALPPVVEEVPPKSIRSAINELVRGYSYSTGESYSSLWNYLYKEYRYIHHVDLSARAKNENKKVLEYAEDMGVINKLYAVANKLFGSCI